MSFAGTPLGQGRRLDHQTFLGKPPSSNGTTGNNNPQTQRITPVPSSYSSGAPPLGSRSPPKPSSSRERVDTNNLNPEKWSVRDTSVNAASAIYQAMSNPNTAWASSSRTARTSNPPRSTSVEYESQASNNARRLGAPPSRLGSKANNKPLSMNSSSRSIVPDSEGEQSQSQILDYSREKSPFSFDQLTNLAQTAIQKTSYFVREKQREDQQPNGNASYDYSAEEREYQQYERNVNANASSSKNLSSSAVHRKNRISTDNKAYKPSQEESEESSDDDVSDTRKRRRKKGASGPAGGPLTTLPKVGPEKRRKKGSRKANGGAANGEEEDEEEETDKEQNISASQRASVPPPARRSQSRQLPDSSLSFIHNQSHSLNLDAIPEDPDPDLVDPESNPGEFYDDSYSHRSYLDDTHSLTSLRPSSGIGARLGTIVYTLFRLIGTGLTSVAHFAGRALGQIVSVLVLWPIRGVLKLPKNPLAYYFLVAFVILFGAWMVNKVPTGLSPPSSGWSLSSPWPFSSSGGSIKYTPPALPVENVAELNARLRALESTLSALVLENEQTKTRLRMTEEEVKEYEKERAKEAKEKEREQVTERQRERSRMQQQAIEREKERERATQQGKSEPGEIKEIVGRLGALEGLVKKDISGRVSKVEDVVGGFNRIQERKEKEERERQARLAVEAKEARETREREERFKERLERDVREREQKERERDQREREKENQRQKEEKERQQREERERLILNQVKKEMESLKSVIGALQSQPSSGSGSSSVGSDIEARTQLALLEERIGSIEGGVKEALDLGNNALKTIKSSSQHPDSQSNWWSKISPSSSKSGLTIKSTDGQDVTSLLTHLVSSAVSSAVSIHSKDSIARADYALHSGGARVIPSLTSDTFALRAPSTFTSQLLGLIPFSGSGFGFGGPGNIAVGRPPVWALHPDITNGLCWPFPGSHGQLGIALAAPVVVDSVTIDHVAAETAYEDGLADVKEEGQDGDEDVEDGHVERKSNRRRSKRRSAPREMEVWGLVEGRENIHKVKEWREGLITQRQAKDAAPERGEEQDFNHLDDLLGTSELDVPYPSTLPKSPMYIRLASFTYDIHSPSHIQTFPVLPYLSKYGKLGEAGVDFGVVALVVRSNWGMEEYTCLYRVRVHGERGMIGGIEESW
ncbi:hypothetical protein EV368DRAFT_65237 [Lentinula lateritia]|nr:hypothetical protein EV368DRAFT_65237 [Lentinula lateritia]